MTVTLPLDPDELLTTTRSVRKRLDLGRPVPIELVRECVEVALQAPSGGNSQGWHWVVVTDPGHRAAIGDYYRRAFDSYRKSAGYAGRVGGEARRAAQGRVADRAEFLAAKMGEVPVHVIACIDAAEELPTGNQAGLSRRTCARACCSRRRTTPARASSRRRASHWTRCCTSIAGSRLVSAARLRTTHPSAAFVRSPDPGAGPPAAPRCARSAGAG